MIHTTTNSGLHDFVATQVLAKLAKPGVRAADLGSGPGAMAARLKAAGCDVIASDRSADNFEAELPHVTIDFNQPDFAAALGLRSFGLVTAIEVIEHVESPIGFLRNVATLLSPGGCAVITTPNVDSLPARFRFLLSGKIRAMDEFGEPTHISPIHLDLLNRQYLPLAGLRLKELLVYPPGGFQMSRKPVAWTMSLLASLSTSKSLAGDNYILLLETLA